MILQTKLSKLKLLQMSRREQVAVNMSGRRLRELKNVFSCPLRRFKRIKKMTQIACILQLKVVREHHAQSNRRILHDLGSLPPKVANEGQVLQLMETLQNRLGSKSIEVARSQKSLLRLPQVKL